MRAITIKKIELPDKSSVYISKRHYAVYLGNSVTVYFTSLKDAKRFLAETNRFLNDQIHELNYIYSQIFVEYRKAWFFFDKDKKNEIEVITSIRRIEDYFNKLVTRGQTINGNVFIFNWIKELCSLLLQALGKIIDILHTKSYFSEIRRIKGIEKQVKYILMEINNYGNSGS